MFRIAASIDVELPAGVVYNQWTQFEDFPDFMEGVKKVEQLAGGRLRWHDCVGGIERQWEARVVEQTPHQRIAWQSEVGPHNAAMVTLHPLSASSTRVKLELDVEPGTMIRPACDVLGMARRRAAADLERFRQFIESRRREDGSWRGGIGHTL